MGVILEHNSWMCLCVGRESRVLEKAVTRSLHCVGFIGLIIGGGFITPLKIFGHCLIFCPAGWQLICNG